MMDKFSFVKQELESRRKAHLLRSLKTVDPINGVIVKIQDRELINFSSNDYLGLAFDPRLKRSSEKYLKRYGNGSTSSRLVSGNHPVYELVETKLAELKGCQSALVFNSGFQANLSIIPAIADKNAIIFSDQLNHNSLIQGALLSRCKVKIFKHNDLDDLEALLKSSFNEDCSLRLILTETVFSMDGDRLDIDKLVLLAKKYNAITMVDEAHATGILGENGMGLSVGKGLDLVMGTFGKAMGSFGAYLCSSKSLAEYLINRCSGLIYTTALPPAILGAIYEALVLVPLMQKERKHLFDLVDRLRTGLNQLGFNTGLSTTPIIPVIIGSEAKTLELESWLNKKGFLAVAIRPPTVEKGQARIRLTVSAAHQIDQIEKLLTAFKEWKEKT